MYRVGILLLCLVWSTGGCSPQEPEVVTGTLDFVHADGTVIRTINIDIAADERTRQKGLMDRRSLTLDEGMLFIFPSPDSQSFWMRNTYIPLDIMFIGKDSSIVNIARRTTPLSDQLINSDGPAQYVVEVRGGFSERFDIDKTTKVRWQRDTN